MSFKNYPKNHLRHEAWRSIEGYNDDNSYSDDGGGGDILGIAIGVGIFIGGLISLGIGYTAFKIYCIIIIGAFIYLGYAKHKRHNIEIRDQQIHNAKLWKSLSSNKSFTHEEAVDIYRRLTTDDRLTK